MSASLPLWLRLFDGLLVRAALVSGGLLLTFMVVLGTVNVLVMRKLLAAPIKGAEDLLILSLVLLVAVSIPFGGRTGAHIEIEVLEARMSPAFAKWSFLALRLVAGALMLLMARELLHAGDKAVKFGETTQQLLISYQPFYYILALCTALYALILLSDIWQLVATGRVRQIELGAAL
ncbi:MAG: TRAP transporter small permease [Leisingera sp.]